MSTGATTNVFIYQVDPSVEGRIVKFAQVEIESAQRGMTIEQTGWLTYVRQSGTPPEGQYYVFAGGHTYTSGVTETPTVVDTGVPAS